MLTRKSEEQRHLAVLGHVAARVQGQHSLRGHEVVHEGEETLLHFAGILSAEDNHLIAVQIHINGCERGHVFAETVHGEVAGVVDGEARLAEVVELLLCWANAPARLQFTECSRLS